MARRTDRRNRGRTRGLVGPLPPASASGWIGSSRPPAESLGQIFMGRKPRAGGRMLGGAAPVDGHSNATPEHPPVRGYRFGGNVVVGEAGGVGPTSACVRLF